MKGYNVSSFINGGKDLDKKNLYEKIRPKAIEILLECEKKCRRDKKVPSKKI